MEGTYWGEVTEWGGEYIEECTGHCGEGEGAEI